MQTFEAYLTQRLGPGWVLAPAVRGPLQLSGDRSIVSERLYRELEAAWKGEAPEPSNRKRRNRGY